jgi:hypothetical protein
VVTGSKGKTSWERALLTVLHFRIVSDGFLQCGNIPHWFWSFI